MLPNALNTAAHSSGTSGWGAHRHVGALNREEFDDTGRGGDSSDYDTDNEQGEWRADLVVRVLLQSSLVCSL